MLNSDVDMSVIVRIDVDRPFGRRNFVHRLASRIASELYFPKVQAFHYLDDLKFILKMLNQRNVRSFVFFRRCSLPDRSVMGLIEEGRHIAGMHLENSRSLYTFRKELRLLESRLGSKVVSFSKHGSGIHKYGLRHFAPYEPEKYLEWGVAEDMKFFFGNLEDATIIDYFYRERLRVFPSAFWLEENYRDLSRFGVEWLSDESEKHDVVLLFHPDNVTASPKLMEDLGYILSNAQTGIP